MDVKLFFIASGNSHYGLLSNKVKRFHPHIQNRHRTHDAEGNELTRTLTFEYG
jgi:hypothetical protein